jgi:hypothetical protein
MIKFPVIGLLQSIPLGILGGKISFKDLKINFHHYDGPMWLGVRKVVIGWVTCSGPNQATPLLQPSLAEYEFALKDNMKYNKFTNRKPLSSESWEMRENN